MLARWGRYCPRKLFIAKRQESLYLNGWDQNPRQSKRSGLRNQRRHYPLFNSTLTAQPFFQFIGLLNRQHGRVIGIKGENPFFCIERNEEILFSIPIVINLLLNYGRQPIGCLPFYLDKTLCFVTYKPVKYGRCKRVLNEPWSIVFTTSPPVYHGETLRPVDDANSLLRELCRRK